MELKIAKYDTKTVNLDSVFMHFPHLSDASIPANTRGNKYYSVQFAMDKELHKETLDLIKKEAEDLATKYLLKYFESTEGWTLTIPALFDGESLSDERFDKFMFLKCSSHRLPPIYDSKGDVLENGEIEYIRGAVVHAEVILRGQCLRYEKMFKVGAVLKALWLPYYPIR